METLSQIMVLLIGPISIFLLTRPGKIRRWGSVIGLIQQPCWFYSTWTHDQFGMFILSLWYAGCYLSGTYYGFFKKEAS